MNSFTLTCKPRQNMRHDKTLRAYACICIFVYIYVYIYIYVYVCVYVCIYIYI